MDRIAEHLHWTTESCSVYLVEQRGRWLAIDCGNHLAPTFAGPLVDRLLLTHFHRDQCGAAAAWQRAGIEVVLPFAEKRLFEEGDLIRASYDTYDNYTSYFPGAGPLEDIAGTDAHDYESIGWERIEFQVVPLPGHTYGSVGYLFELDGKRMLACGDLMCGPGKLREYYWNQWKYMDFQGHVNQLESLRTASELGADLILPGHGSPFAATPQAFDDLRKPLEELWTLFYNRPYEYYEPVFRPLTQHVVEVSNSGANTYIVRDGEGHGLLIDCGYTSNAPIGTNPHRFIDQLTPYLGVEVGVKDVEWFLPSHYHDDHLAGLPALQNRYGTKVATSPELQEIIEHPERFDMPCLVPRGSAVDAVVERDQVFSWRGIDFRIQQHPGQTLYHNLIDFTVDGQRFLSIGDNVSGMSFREERNFVHSFIPKNRTPVSAYRDMPRQIVERQPDWLLTGHGGAVHCDREQVEQWQRWMDRWDELFTGIIDQPTADMGMDPHWVEFSPYKVRVKAGDEVEFQVRVKNHEQQASTALLRYRASGGAEVRPLEDRVELAAGVTAVVSVAVRIPDTFSTHSLTIVADLIWNDRPLGEFAEAIAYW